MPNGFAPILHNTGITDRENNTVYQTVVIKEQADDVVKALRKAGITGRLFQFDRETWDSEKRELVTLKESYENKRKTLNQVATDMF